MTEDEIDLLLWLSEEDFSQYGECYGKSLTRLIKLGLAQHHPGTGYDNTFIAKGRGIMFEAVSLTEQGRTLARKLKEQEDVEPGTGER